MILINKDFALDIVDCMRKEGSEIIKEIETKDWDDLDRGEKNRYSSIVGWLNLLDDIYHRIDAIRGEQK